MATLLVASRCLLNPCACMWWEFLCLYTVYNWINAQRPVLQYRALPEITDKANPIRMPLNPSSSGPAAWQRHMAPVLEKHHAKKAICSHILQAALTNFVVSFQDICTSSAVTQQGVEVKTNKQQSRLWKRRWRYRESVNTRLIVIQQTSLSPEKWSIVKVIWEMIPIAE